jgi:hypothetical protein
MDWRVSSHPTDSTHSTQNGRDPVFVVRRDPNGDCSGTCDFNLGRCLMRWRHPGGNVPWDPRCRDGDAYAFALVEAAPTHKPSLPT